MKFSTEYNYKKSILKIIHFLLLITLLLLMLVIPGAFCFNSIDTNTMIILHNIDGINLVIGILSIISCAFYYNMYKENKFFLLILSYISIYIEYVAVNIILIEKAEYYLNIRSMIIFPFLLRCVLLTIIVKKESKLSKMLLKKKKLSILGFILLTVLGICFEILLRQYFRNSLFSYTYMTILNTSVVIYYYILLLILTKKCLSEKVFLYAIIISSLSILNIRRIFSNSIVLIDSNVLYEYNKLLSFIGFIIIIIGLLIEIDIKVNENKHLKNQMAYNEKNLSAITENIKDLIFIKNSEGKISYVNRMAVTSLGYREDELIGMPYKDLIKNEKDKAFDNKNNVIFINQELKCKNGEILPIESIFTTIMSSNNDNFSRMIVARDCSFKYEAEMLNKKFQEMKELDTVRTQFFSNISHEIRTPINIIYSCVQLLENKIPLGDKDLSTAYKKYNVTLKQNCFRMLRLVNNLVDITKIDAGFMKINFVNYDIVNLVENITLSTIPYVTIKNINIVFDTTVEELFIKCDPESIERIILNLLSNSVKYTEPHGNILVFIDYDSDWVTIKVKDDGIGIPFEFRKTIFDRFVQTDRTLHRKKEGSGIGLALVKSLVDLHGGNIYVSHENDIGTEFVVKLPNVTAENTNSININLSVDNMKKNNISKKISLEFSDIYDIS